MNSISDKTMKRSRLQNINHQSMSTIYWLMVLFTKTASFSRSSECTQWLTNKWIYYITQNYRKNKTFILLTRLLTKL